MKDEGRGQAAGGEITVPRWAVAIPLAAGLGLALSIGFLLWLVAGGVNPARPEIALASYARWLLAGSMAGAVLTAAIPVSARAAWLARISYASSVFYLGFLAVLGWPALPWVLFAAACALLAALRRSDLANAGTPLLLFHVMCSLGALYMTFQLGKFLAAWPAFLDVLKGLWLVVASTPT